MTDENRTPLPTENKAAQAAVDVVQGAANAAETVVEDAAIAAEPWLGFPGIKQLWETVLDYFVKQFSRALGTLAGYVLVDAEEYLALKKAAASLVKLNAAKATGDANAIEQASAEADAAAAPILHYVGSTHTS